MAVYSTEWGRKGDRPAPLRGVGGVLRYAYLNSGVAKPSGDLLAVAGEILLARYRAPTNFEPEAERGAAGAFEGWAEQRAGESS